jgi:hypothetical protein
MFKLMMKTGFVTFFGLIVFLTWAGAQGTLPKKGTITDDTALLQRVTEINVAKELLPKSDLEIAALASKESRFKEDLPSLKRSSLHRGKQAAAPGAKR